MSARDFMGAGGLVASSYAEAEDADPRVGLVNLADVMLVFACGLMLALVTYWNLDISTMTEVVEADQMAEVSGLEDMADQLGEGGSSFTELGKVYQDPMTGKMYMMKEDVGDAEAGGSDEGAAGTASGEASSDGADGVAGSSASGDGNDSGQEESWDEV